MATHLASFRRLRQPQVCATKFAELPLNQMFDWNDLRYFLAVAREGSTVAAAKALRVNQSTVQRRLAALEEAIGSRLVERTPTGYRLTETGLALRPHAEAVEGAVEAFQRQIASVDTELTGTIRVTCPEGIAYLVLTPLLEKFHTRYPGLRVDVILTDRILDLAKGEADVAMRVAPLEDSTLVGRKISDLTWGFYASRAYAERHGRMQRKRGHRPACPDRIRRRARRHPGGAMAARGRAGCADRGALHQRHRRAAEREIRRRHRACCRRISAIPTATWSACSARCRSRWRHATCWRIRTCTRRRGCAPSSTS